MFAFGLSNHSPDQAVNMFLSKGIIADESEIAVLPSGTRLRENKKPVREVIFVLSIPDFRRNLEVFNSTKYANARVFLFASALRINELNNVVALDFDKNPERGGLGFNMRKDLNLPLYRRALKCDEGDGVKHAPIKYLNTLTDNVKRGSLLNPLMTFIYTLPSGTHQTRIKEAIAKYIYRGLSYKKLEEFFDEMKDITITKRVRDRFKEILTSEIGENYKAAFKALHDEPDAAKGIEKVCKKFQTSDYEMRYLKSIVDSIGQIKVKKKTAH